MSDDLDIRVGDVWEARDGVHTEVHGAIDGDQNFGLWCTREGENYCFTKRGSFGPHDFDLVRLISRAEPAAPAEITDADVEAYLAAAVRVFVGSGANASDSIRAGLRAFLAHRGERT